MRFSRTVLVLSFVLLFCFSLTTFFLFSPPPAQNICITTSSSPSVSTISTTSSSPLQLSPSKPLIDYSWGTILSAFLPTYFSSAFTFPSYSPSPFSFASPSSTAPSSTSFLQTLRICFIVLRDLDRSLRDVVGLLLSSGASVTLVTLQGGGAGVGGQQGLVHIAIPTKQEFYVGPSILSSLAYRVKNFLHDKQHDFDVVHFKESEGEPSFFLFLFPLSLSLPLPPLPILPHLCFQSTWDVLSQCQVTRN